MLLPPPEGTSALRRLVANDEWAGQIAERILETADMAFGAEPIAYALNASGTLLDTARSIADRIHTLGVAWMISGHPRFQRRIVGELLSAASYRDWNRSHFLDTAEMMAAVAIGYDWSKPVLTGVEDKRISNALIKLGLIPARSSFQRPSGWINANTNWTMVCASASILAALAVRQAAPELAEEVMLPARETFGRALQLFEPDGGWNEGPSYWALATDYAVLALSALETSNEPLLPVPASFLATWKFGRALTSPSGMSFNYGDNLLDADRCHALGWLARRSGDADAAHWQRRAPGEPRPLDLLWAETSPVGVQDRPQVQRFACGVSTLTDGNIWIGLKGGSNAVNHAHLDLGTIALEVSGKQFISDLGREDYAAPGYFDPKRRFSYFRAGTLAHNTVVFRKANQSIAASAIDLGSRTANSISAAYRIEDPDAPCRFSRAVEIVPGMGAVVADRITLRGSTPIDADWVAHTTADAVMHEGGATLSLEGISLGLKTIASFDAKLLLEPVPTPAGQSDNSAFRRIRIPFSVGSDPATITTILATGEEAVTALSEWGSALQFWLSSNALDE